MRNISTVLVTVGSSLMLGLTSTALSQTPATNAAPAQTGSPKIQFALTTYNFGRVSAGTLVKEEFVFTNTGDATLEITSVSPHCGCTTAGEWDKKVEPGKTGKIPLQVNTANFNGQVTKTAAISCNDTSSPSITLQITGTVWKPIEVNPNMVSFNFPFGQVTNETRTVRIINNQEEAVTLSDVQSGNPAFLAELKTVEAGKVFELTVTTVPASITSTVSSAITLKTSATNVPTISVNAMAIIQPAPQPAAPAAPAEPAAPKPSKIPTLTAPDATASPAKP